MVVDRSDLQLEWHWRPATITQGNATVRACVTYLSAVSWILAHSTFAGELLEPTPITVGDRMLDVEHFGHASPFVADFDNDGLQDLFITDMHSDMTAEVDRRLLVEGALARLKPDDIVDRLIAGGSDTRSIAKGVCAATLGSGVTLVQ